MKKHSKKETSSYHHRGLKPVLIAAALDLVKEKGTRGFTLTEASRKAGVSVAAPYRHFRDKDALLATIVVEGNVRLETSLREAADGCGNDSHRLQEIAVAYVAFAQKYRDYFEVMFHSGIDKSRFPEIQSSGRKAFQVAYEAAAEARRTSETEAMQLALAVWTMAHGIAALAGEGALSLIAGSNNEVERTARQLIGELLRAHKC